MSINNLNTYLNVRDAHLRVVSGNVYAQAMNIGGINVETAHGLQSVSNTGNATSLTLEFANVTTGFVTTANAQIGRDLVVTGNATVSSDLTVSANATVTDTLTVSEHLLASKEATVTGNLHVTTIMSDSNVVAEYTGPHDRPLRKYPEVALTQNDESATSGYVASASSTATYDTNLQPENAFNGVISPSSGTASWQSSDSGYSGTTPFNYLNSGTHTVSLTDTDGTVHYGDWLSLQTPNRIKVSYYKIHTLNDVDNYRPDSFVLLGSNSETDGTWKLLHTETSGMTDPGPEVYTGHVNSAEFYTYHRLLVKSLAGNGGEAYINELEYYGHEEGSGSLDTTLKSVYNVPATTGTQLDVYYDAKDLTTMPSTVTDLSGGDQNGTVAGHSPTLDNNSFVFDGVDDYITTTLTNPNTDWVHSASMWVYPTDISDDSVNGYIFAIGPEVSNQVSALRFRPDGFNYTRWQNGGAKIFNGPVTSGRWHHVTLVSPGSTDVQVYLDGRLLGYTSDSLAALTLPQNTSLSVGRFAASASYSRPFNGSIANFRLYSKALNAEQVQELYEYQKDYFLGSKSQVTLYKGHLGVGVTEPSGQLELAGDEQIQAYPPRGMTNTNGKAAGTNTNNSAKNITYIEGHGEFKASASLRSRQDVDYDGHQPYNAFDYTDEDFLIYGPGSQEDVGYNKTTGYYEDNEYRLSASSGTPYGHWLQLEMPYKINVKSYFIQHHHNDYWPQDWQIWASNDDVNWTHIHTYTGGTYGNNPQYYTVAHTGHYKIYTMIITRIKEGSSLDRIRIQELRYFGTPGPTTLDKGSLTLGRSLDVPRVSRYDVDTETPRPENLLVDLDTTVNGGPTDISGKGNHGTFVNGASYSAADKAFIFDGSTGCKVEGETTFAGGTVAHSMSCWFKVGSGISGTTNAGTILSLGTYSSSPPGSQISALYVYDDRLGVYHWNNDILTEVGTFDVDDKSWHMMTYVHLGGAATTANQRIYLDGVSLPVTTGATYTGGNLVIASNAKFTVGATAQTNANMFTGLVSNPKLYNVALEPSEVRKLYKLGRTGRSMVISDTAVGIGKVPEAQLDVRGNLNVDGVITNQQRPAFYVWRDGTSGTTAYKSTTGVITNWDSKRIDTAGTFDLSNGRYYIPVSGLYNFVGAGLYRYGGSGNGILEVSFYVNGSNVNVRGISYNRGMTSSEHHTVTITFMRFMNVGDYVQMGIHAIQSACDLYYGDNLGYFSGYLLG